MDTTMATMELHTFARLVAKNEQKLVSCRKHATRQYGKINVVVVPAIFRNRYKVRLKIVPSNWWPLGSCQSVVPIHKIWSGTNLRSTSNWRSHFLIFFWCFLLICFSVSFIFMPVYNGSHPVAHLPSYDHITRLGLWCRRGIVFARL